MYWLIIISICNLDSYFTFRVPFLFLYIIAFKQHLKCINRCIFSINLFNCPFNIFIFFYAIILKYSCSLYIVIFSSQKKLTYFFLQYFLLRQHLHNKDNFVFPILFHMKFHYLLKFSLYVHLLSYYFLYLYR